MISKSYTSIARYNATNTFLVFISSITQWNGNVFKANTSLLHPLGKLTSMKTIGLEITTLLRVKIPQVISQQPQFQIVT